MPTIFPTAAALCCAVVSVVCFRLRRPFAFVGLAGVLGALVFARPAVVAAWPGYEPIAAVARGALIAFGLVAILALLVLAVIGRQWRCAAWAGMVTLAFAAWPMSTVFPGSAAVLCYVSLFALAGWLLTAARRHWRLRHGPVQT
jgi:hypothetical protein